MKSSLSELPEFVVRTGAEWVKRKGRDRWGRTKERVEASRFRSEAVVAFRLSDTPYTIEPC